MMLNDGDRVIIIIACAVFITLGLRLAYLVIRGEQPVKVRKVTTIRFAPQTPPVSDSESRKQAEWWAGKAAETRAQVEAEAERQASRDASYTAADEIIAAFECGVSDKMDE